MPIFLLIGRHSPENCPAPNEKARKVWIKYFSKLDGILQKHGMKILGNWAVPKEHLAFAVLEAPSLEAFQKLGMEPEALAMSAYEKYEVKSALDMKEVVKRLRAK